MVSSLQFIAYRRPFVVPLVTAHGHWFEREGLLVRIEDRQGRVGFGEVAPLPAFGTETVDEAADYLRSLRGRAPGADLADVPEALRCCRFAIGSAWRQLQAEAWPVYHFQNCALLPSGETAIEALTARVEEGFTTFKLKVGVEPLHEDIKVINTLLAMLPEGGRLRLDGNGGFEERDLEEFQSVYSAKKKIEFLEQPLAPGYESLMAELAGHEDLAFALDESVASVDDFANMVELGQWNGAFVLKASIMGAPDALLAAARKVANPLVLSSVFETAIGLHSVLSLGAELELDEPVGFGTLGFFGDELNGFSLQPELNAADLSPASLVTVWDRVCADFARN